MDRELIKKLTKQSDYLLRQSGSGQEFYLTDYIQQISDQYLAVVDLVEIDNLLRVTISSNIDDSQLIDIDFLIMNKYS